MENTVEIYDEVDLFAFPKVIKRSGEDVKFDPDKIHNAIKKAYTSVYGEMDDQAGTELNASLDVIISQIEKLEQEKITIYDIQDIVELTLMDYDKKVAQEYVSYRAKQDVLREEKKRSQDINFTINKLINKDHTTVNENANKDSNVYNTQRDLTAGIVGKSIGMKMLPDEVATAHMKGDIHYHDLDYHPYSPMTNCCLIDFEEMLNNGFRMGNADVESPKSIQTATAQISQIIANVASSQYGGCTADRIDEDRKSVV